VQITDTHLSPGHTVATHRLDAVIREVNLDPPDLVVNTGDIVWEDPDDVIDRAFARRHHERFNAPVLAIPGNHDTGESGWTPWNGPVIDAARRDAFSATWDGDRFCVDRRSWRLIGLNAQLIAGPLPDAEAEQDSWLDRALGGATHIALFLHKPIQLTGDEDPGWSIEAPGRQRLLDRLAGGPVRLVACGHLHRHRVRFDPHHGWLDVWAPSTVFVSESEPDGSHRITGYLEYELADDGGVDVHLVEP